MRLRLSLTGRMFAALFGMSAVMIALVAVWAGWALDRRFSAYVSAAALAGMDPLVAALEHDYADHGDWSGVADVPHAWEAILHRAGQRPPGPPDWPAGAPPQPPPMFGAGPPPGRPPGLPPGPPLGAPMGPPPFGLLRHPGARLAMTDAQGHAIAGAPAAMVHPARRDLVVNGAVVGTLLFDAGPMPDGIEGTFLAERMRDLYVAAGVALALSGLVATLLARSILAPVRLVAAGARRLASGAFATRLETGRRDELGELVRDFNRLAESLDRSEEARRLWVADTSHELRTPLAVMQAQIEALQDGVHPLGPRSLDRLHEEVRHMTKLVGDLHELARADSHALALHLEPTRPGELMREVLDGFAARRQAVGLQLQISLLGNDDAVVMADPGRLRQVFGNLLENAIRYTDPGGMIEVAERVADGRVHIRVDDTAPGVPPAKLPQLFERFFRVETSRSRRTGGSGLGLAICRAIVEAHAGTIRAASSRLGGLEVTVTLPCAAAPHP